jgi:uncharacterized protein (TIGR02246 family)
MKAALTVIAALALATPWARGDEPKAAPDKAAQPGRDNDKKAIQEVVDAFKQAFNKGDVKAISALFTEDAEVVDEHGGKVQGRQAITEHFAAGFGDAPGAKIEIDADSLRFLGADAATEEGRARVLPADGSAPELTRYLVIYVKQGGKWLQSSVREYPDTQVSHHDRLKELEWMLGDWIDESADSVVFTTCAWSEDKNFLLREFTIQVSAKPVMKGSQRIGWDPVSRHFKSWVFDSEGGYAEGFWSHDGNRWIVKSTGVMPDGLSASSTSVFTRVNKDTVRWKAVDRTVGGRALPDVPEFVMVRKPPKPR